MYCKKCAYEMIPSIKPKDELLERAATTTTFFYWRYFKCPECGWQYMAHADKVFNLADAEKVINEHYVS